jgi:hypothetical protein
MIVDVDYVNFISAAINVSVTASRVTLDDSSLFLAALTPLAVATELFWVATRDVRAETASLLPICLLAPSTSTASLLLSTLGNEAGVAASALLDALETSTIDRRACQTVSGLSLLGGISSDALTHVSESIVNALCNVNAGTLPSLLSSALVSTLNDASGSGVDESAPAPTGFPLSASLDAVLLAQLLTAIMIAGARARRRIATSAAASTSQLFFPLYTSDRKVALEIALRGETDAASHDMALRWASLARALASNGEEEEEEGGGEI